VEESQKYKEGKYILEKGKIMKVMTRTPLPRFYNRAREASPDTSACVCRRAAGSTPPHHNAAVNRSSLYSVPSASVDPSPGSMLGSAAQRCYSSAAAHVQKGTPSPADEGHNAGQWRSGVKLVVYRLSCLIVGDVSSHSNAIAAARTEQQQS
jgi:hypothetical protein